MTLSEKIWGNAIGAFVQYGYTAAKAALLPLKVTDNGDNTGTLNVSGTIALPTGAATSAKQDTGNASLASIKTAVEGATPDTTASDFAAIHAHLAAVETLLQTTGITILPLDSSIDSIDVDKMAKGPVTTAHSAITATATSAEIDCRGYNSLLIHLETASTDKTWTISILGAMGSDLTFAPHLDKATGLADSVIATDISGFFVVNDIPDYVKVVATDTDDSSTAMTLKVQPFNS